MKATLAILILLDLSTLSTEAFAEVRTETSDFACKSVVTFSSDDGQPVVYRVNSSEKAPNGLYRKGSFTTVLRCTEQYVHYGLNGSSKETLELKAKPECANYCKASKRWTTEYRNMRNTVRNNTERLGDIDGRVQQNSVEIAALWKSSENTGWNVRALSENQSKLTQAVKENRSQLGNHEERITALEENNSQMKFRLAGRMGSLYNGKGSLLLEVVPTLKLNSDVDAFCGLGWYCASCGNDRKLNGFSVSPGFDWVPKWLGVRAQGQLVFGDGYNLYMAGAGPIMKWELNEKVSINGSALLILGQEKAQDAGGKSHETFTIGGLFSAGVAYTF